MMLTPSVHLWGINGLFAYKNVLPSLGVNVNKSEYALLSRLHVAQLEFEAPWNDMGFVIGYFSFTE